MPAGRAHRHAQRKQRPAFLLHGMIEPEKVADCVIEGLAAERFLILPHPEVHEYMQRKAGDYDRWLRGMRRLQEKIMAALVRQGLRPISTLRARRAHPHHPRPTRRSPSPPCRRRSRNARNRRRLCIPGAGLAGRAGSNGALHRRNKPPR
jgi:hypothetical protein